MADCVCTNFPANLGNVTIGASLGIGTMTPFSKLSLGSANTGFENRIAVYEGGGADFRGIGMANPAGGVFGVAVWANTTPGDGYLLTRA